MSPERITTVVDGQQLELSNLEKVFYPSTGFTKGELLDYYARIAEVMVPHLKNRPVTLKRYPNGVEAPSFFEKHAPKHAPQWVRTAEVPSTRSGSISFVVINDRPSLLWAANLAAIEYHVPMWRVERAPQVVGRADLMVFDLDPGPGTTIVDCCQVAIWIRNHLGSDSLCAKTSGSKGLQLYLPLKKSEREGANERAHKIAEAIEKDHADAVVSNMRKTLREHKVLIDWSQNNPAKTTVAVYSLRAMPRPSVSTPITWDEVGACAQRGDPQGLQFDPHEVLERIEKLGDLFSELAPR